MSEENHNMRDIVKIARNLINNKDYNEAEALLLEAFVDDNASSILPGMLAELYLKIGNLAEAEKYVEISLQRNPADIYSLQRKGDVLVKKNQIKAALEIYYDLYKNNQNDFFLGKRIAKANYLAGDYSSALVYADRVVEAFPGRHDIYFLKFQIYVKQGNAKEARAAINKALEISPGNSFYYSQKMSLKVKEQNADSNNIKELLEFEDDKNPHLLKLYAEKLKDEGNLEGAVEAYKQLIALDDSEFNQKSLAYLYYKMKQFDKAFTIFVVMPDASFNDTIFVNVLCASAKTREQKTTLLDRLVPLASGMGFNKLWGRINKLKKELNNEAS